MLLIDTCVMSGRPPLCPRGLSPSGVQLVESNGGHPARLIATPLLDVGKRLRREADGFA